MLSIAIALIIIAFLILKILEILYHIWIMLTSSHPDFELRRSERWPVTMLLARYHVHYIYRLPLLAFALFLLSPCLMYEWIMWSALVALFFAIWSHILQSIISIIVLGIAEFHFRDFSTALEVRPARTALPAREQRIRITIVFFIATVVTTIIAYSGIFVCLDQINPCSFSESIGNRVNAVYFSTVTLATVGYGDIEPDSRLARCLTASEIWAGICVLISLVFAHSITNDTKSSK